MSDAIKLAIEALEAALSDDQPYIVECKFALAALRAQPAGWLPIESAPKDGAHILLSNGTEVSQGWWEHEEPYIREQRDSEGVYIDQQEHDGYDGWIDCGGGMLPEPTHWMPLPPPPNIGNPITAQPNHIVDVNKLVDPFAVMGISATHRELIAELRKPMHYLSMKRRNQAADALEAIGETK